MKVFTAIILSIICSRSVAAQDSNVCKRSMAEDSIPCYRANNVIFEKPSFLRNISHIPADLSLIGKAPFRKKNLMGMGVVAGSTIILIAVDEKVIAGVRDASEGIGLNPETKYGVLWKSGQTKILKYPKNLNTAFYQLGEGGSSIMIAGGFWLYGKIRQDRRAVGAAYDLTESLITMGVTTQLMKRVSGRESPFKATKKGGDWAPFPSFYSYQNNTSSYDAFPSGHLATLMATVTVLRRNYPEKKWIGPVGYSLMGLTAWAMMNTEVHWASDYPLALAIGYLSGRASTRRHQQKRSALSRFDIMKN
jgi:membrane-associated phospholipid phosphatase